MNELTKKEREKQYHRQYYLDNKEKIDKSNKQWKLNNKGYHKKYLKTYQLNNKKKLSEYNKYWKAINEEKIAVYVKRHHGKYKDTKKHRRIQVTYGLSPTQYTEMLNAQNNNCKICGNKPTKAGLGVDHCHATSKVRGLLCQRCNCMLGCAKDKISTLYTAIEYLQSSIN